jgi:hypothetical protein
MKVLDALKAKGITVPPKLMQAWEKETVAEGAAADFMIAQLKEKRPKMFETNKDLEALLAKNEVLLCTLFSEFMAAEGVDVAATTPDASSPDAAAAAVTEAEKAAAAKKAADEAMAQQVREGLARINAFALEGMLSTSELDDNGKKLIRQRFNGENFDQAKVQEAVTEVKDMIAKIRTSVTPTHLRVVSDEADGVARAWADLFFTDVRESTVREAVAESAGKTLDRNGRKVTGVSKHAGGEILSIHRLCEMTLGRPVDWTDRQQVQEAMDTVVAAAVLVNGMNLRVAYQFNLESEWRDFMKVCNIVPINDMKTKNVIASGSLSGWAVKNSSTGFPTLTASGATKESYTPAEYGGIHAIEWINFVNDDTGYFQQIPRWIGDESLFALNDFYWGTLVADNPALTDTVVVFIDNPRGNYMTEALSDDALTTAIGKIQQIQHPGKTSGRPRMTRAKFLAVTSAVAQQKKAFELITPAFGATNAVAGFTQSRGMQVIVNPISTDPNDWWLFGGDPAGIVEIGVYGGRIEPTIVIANDPGVGRRFTHNEIQIKGEQDYGGNWVTPKNALWSHVAG